MRQMNILIQIGDLIIVDPATRGTPSICELVMVCTITTAMHEIFSFLELLFRLACL